ncbi:ninG protein [Pseudomonas fluorescens HK44]|uniref:NinG protein n=1 Tax=Pseudomonas fluorescens HK44 TaxID=1042209 RepID=A0A010S5D3_PSEFL|nr:recombination protein NinG [Pseudomonas fluorescens]EXF95784.1 ninG protein [Pseudomonas fluorescens HK44]
MSLPAKQPRPKKCRVESCRALFVPSRLGQAVCSPACAILDAPKNHERAGKALADVGRKELRAAKEKVKTRADHMKDAQRSFNTWIRLRDAGQPCISCGTTANVQYCAGHYRTVGSCPELRFEPHNVHLQCNKNCNMEKSGNIVAYRPRLLEKIGPEMLAWIEGPHEPQRYTIEDLKAITAEYRAKTRELKRAIA